MWNESWFFSWIDHAGGPAGFFRVGVLPNQGRAMLWGFVHVDGGWLGVEESRLAFGDLDLSDGIAYDRWALRFAWVPEEPLRRARFRFEADTLVRSGPNAGTYRTLQVELACTATAPPIPTGTGDDDRVSEYDAARLEQMLSATGTVTVDGQVHTVSAGAHRDRSWGPREWRQEFTLGDLQTPDRQLYFVGRTFPGLGMVLLRDGADVRHLLITDGTLDFIDGGLGLGQAWLRVDDGDTPIEIMLRPIAEPIRFDMAHTCPEPERWPYWRTLVEAQVTGWDAPCRGWFETSRYGTRPEGED